MSDSAKNADRMTAYYEHINQVRIDLINDLRHTQEELKSASRWTKKDSRKDIKHSFSTQKKQEQDLKKSAAGAWKYIKGDW